MRTAVFVFAGFALLALLLVIARNFKPGIASAATIAVPSFIFIWALVSAANVWLEFGQAGYSFMHGLPIFLIIFLLPTVAALFVKWHWR